MSYNLMLLLPQAYAKEEKNEALLARMQVITGSLDMMSDKLVLKLRELHRLIAAKASHCWSRTQLVLNRML